MFQNEVEAICQQLRHKWCYSTISATVFLGMICRLIYLEVNSNELVLDDQNGKKLIW